MKILVTGGCGFIGTNVCLEAIKRKYKVVVLDSLNRKHTEDNLKVLQNKGVEIIRGDVRNYHDLDRLPKVDGVIHLAGNSAVPLSINWPVYDFMTNALGTLNLLEFSRKNGKIPVIYASTNKVYSEEINLIPIKEKGGRYIWNFSKISVKKLRKAVLDGISEKGINENFPIDSSGLFPHSPYGVSKATGDLYCQEYFHIYKIPTVVNRMSFIYGLYQKGVEEQGWLDWFVRAKIKNKTLNIYGGGKQVRDGLFGTDVAHLYLDQLENIGKVKGQVFNVGGGPENSISLLETIEYLNQKGGKKLNLKFKNWRMADHKIYISDISKVTKMLHWQPKTGIYEGIDQIWDQYRNSI